MDFEAGSFGFDFDLGAKLLFDRGGTKLMEMATAEGRTPLLAAACMGHVAVVRFLLDKGGDTNVSRWKFR
jgi:ankyrin repeat protein